MSDSESAADSPNSESRKTSPEAIDSADATFEDSADGEALPQVGAWWIRLEQKQKWDFVMMVSDA